MKERPKQAVATVRLGSLSRKFDVKERPLYQANFVFTQEELEALEDVKLELRREHDVKVSKNDLIRLGLHVLIEDFAAHGDRSHASRRIRERGG